MSQFLRFTAIDGSVLVEVDADDLQPAFGLKAAGEVGNLAVAKASGEASCTVRLLWQG